MGGAISTGKSAFVERFCHKLQSTSSDNGSSTKGSQSSRLNFQIKSVKTGLTDEDHFIKTEVFYWINQNLYQMSLIDSQGFIPSKKREWLNLVVKMINKRVFIHLSRMKHTYQTNSLRMSLMTAEFIFAFISLIVKAQFQKSCK